jgi:hypothetical protein
MKKYSGIIINLHVILILPTIQKYQVSIKVRYIYKIN